MDFTLQSRMKAQKQASASHSHSGNIQKGTSAKPSVGLDSMSVKNALKAPKKEAERGAHRGDKATAPKVATFGNDRSIQAGEFESSPEQSSADTGIHGKAVLSTQSGEFESTPEASHADTGIHGSAVSAAQAGEFESNPVPREW